MSSLAA